MIISTKGLSYLKAVSQKENYESIYLCICLSRDKILLKDIAVDAAYQVSLDFLNVFWFLNIFENYNLCIHELFSKGIHFGSCISEW